MKIIFTFSLVLLVLFPLLNNAQVTPQFPVFEITYAANSNRAFFDYNPCNDVCSTTFANRQACNCKRNCETNEEILRDYEDCLDICYENFGQQDYNYELLTACQENCEISKAIDIVDCKAQCGFYESTRLACGYTYRLWADWAPIPFNPLTHSNPAIFTSFMSVGCLGGGGSPIDVVIPPWTLPFPWPGIADSNNACYGIQITIFYNDGASCIYPTIWRCYIIG